MLPAGRAPITQNPDAGQEDIVTEDMERLLNAVAARQRDIESSPALGPFAGGIERAKRQDDVELGPRLPTGEVFGPTDAGRKRGQRTLRKLEEAGLLIVQRPGGVAIRAKLTPAGAKESLSVSRALPNGLSVAEDAEGPSAVGGTEKLPPSAPPPAGTVVASAQEGPVTVSPREGMRHNYAAALPAGQSAEVAQEGPAGVPEGGTDG